MGSETRARLGLAGLLLVTLFSFEQLFFSSDYSGPSLLAAILAALGAAGARRLGAGIALTALASAAGMVVYLSLVFEADATLWGLPTYDAVRRLGDAVARAVSLSEIDFAPIPSRPGYVILVVAGMWIAAAIGEVAAFRWRRPLLASLPALVLFGYAVIVGSGTGTTLMVLIFLIGLLTFWGLESSHRIGSWGRWIPTFEGKAVEQSSVSGRLGRRMGASCIACALVTPLLLPAFSDGLSWRSGMGTGPGSGSGGVGGGDINLLVSLVPNRLRQSPHKLFEVAAEEEAYWRLVSLDQFDGETWQPPSETRVSASAGFVANTEDSERPTDRRVVQEFRLEGLRGDYLPAAAEPVGLEFPDGDLSLGDVALSSHQDIQLEGGIQDDITYTAESLAPDPTYGELNASIPGIPGQAPARVAQSLTAPVEALRDRWIAPATTDFENLVAIQRQLRKFDYDIDVEDQSSADYLETFLIDTRAGYCQQFATAFALLSRSLGYPTRVSVGFLPGERDENGVFQVTGEDAHAWPEVYFGTYGWIPFEPTPRPGLAQPPDYTNIPQGTGQGEGGLGGLAEVTADLPPAQADRARNFASFGGGNVTAPAAPRPARAPQWQKAFNRIALGLVALAVTFFAAIPLLKEWRTRRRYRRAGAPDDVVAAAFHHFADDASELVAIPHSPSESAVSYARRVGRARAGQDAPALRLAALYETAEYAGAPISESDALRARELARKLRRGLWREASWWQRVLRVFAPTNLGDVLPLPPGTRRRRRRAA